MWSRSRRRPKPGARGRDRARRLAGGAGTPILPVEAGRFEPSFPPDTDASRPGSVPRTGNRRCRPTSPPSSSATRRRRGRTRSCGPACTAASAPRPARPTRCSATSSIRPRGRIYLIKDMLEAGRPADEKTVKHIDRCLSCLACMTTCPSGVHYMHLVDHARAYIEGTYRRPPLERALRWALAKILPYPGRFRAALARGAARAAVRRADAAPAAGDARDGAAVAAAGQPARRAAGLSGRGTAAQAGGAADRLRAAGARPAHQRRDDPAADPPRLRGGGRGGGRVLRGADPPHGQDRREPRDRGAHDPAPGCARSAARGSTRSSSTPRAAAPRSRTTATCSGARRSRATRRRSRAWRATSPS